MAEGLVVHMALGMVWRVEMLTHGIKNDIKDTSVCGTHASPWPRCGA